jgi:hypothetical protein
MKGNLVEFKDLKGLTLSRVDVKRNIDQIIFTSTDGKKFSMMHYQDCCESVGIEDINGDLGDLLNTPIVEAYEATSDNHRKQGEDECWNDCKLWTFYHIRTMKGDVTIRWFGDSSGYYSVDVDFKEI